jgi:predicted transcriptional regulator of viral defense system
VRVLKRLLSTIAAGQVANTAELAAAIDASPAMVEALVGELERRGLLQRAGDCGSVCTGCPTEPECGQQTQASAWLLTAAGRRYAEN